MKGEERKAKEEANGCGEGRHEKAGRGGEKMRTVDRMRWELYLLTTEDGAAMKEQKRKTKEKVY